MDTVRWSEGHTKSPTISVYLFGRCDDWTRALGFAFAPVPPVPTKESIEYGGSFGTPFTDKDVYEDGGKIINKVHVHFDKWIEGFGIEYTDGTKVMHGVKSDKLETVNLDISEDITGVFGREGGAVEAIGFYTSAGRTFGLFGGKGGK